MTTCRQALVSMAAIAMAMGAASPASAAEPAAAADMGVPDTASAAAHWRGLFEADLAYLIETTRTHYIYALYSDDPAWPRRFEAAIGQARRDAALVKDFSTYRAVMQQFVASFEDAHYSAYFNVTSRRGRWPGFAVAYRGGRYVVIHSELSDIATGAIVTSCDGEAVDGWVDRLAPVIGGAKGRDATRAAIGPAIFVDRGNPLYRLPGTCRIGERDMELQWRPISAGVAASVPSEPERTGAPAPTVVDDSVGVSDFGQNGAWVRIGTMMPAGDVRTAQFRELVAVAPTLRDKQVVVIDVRGNSGGPYNWFMAFLRGFYGTGYADYYARARLEISNILLTPAAADPPGASTPSDFKPDEMPADPPMERPLEPRVRHLPGGAKLTIVPAPAGVATPAGAAPRNPVRAQVYLLTDYGCASACISFVDEMRRFPGVIQVGTETHVDRRAGGWPQAYELPSGLAVVRMGRMVREGRKRGENQTWTPHIRFDGDIADTTAVKAWLADTVLVRRPPEKSPQ